MQQGHSGFEVADVLRPLIVQHLLGSQHLLLEGESKENVVGKVARHAPQLSLVAHRLWQQGIHLVYQLRGFLPMIDALLHDVQRQLSLVGLSVPLLLHILDEFLALRAAALVEAGVDIELVGIDQLSHLHAEQQCLAVTLGDAEATQQLGGYLAHLVVGLQQLGGGLAAHAVVIGQLLLPVVFVLAPVAVPGVTAPGLIPHPVAVQLFQSFAAGQAVGRVGPVPVRGLWIKVQPLGVVHAMHGLHRLLDEGGRRPSPGLQVGQDVHVVDVHRSRRGQLPVRLAPGAAGLVGGQALTRVLRHGVDVGIEGQRLTEHTRAVGVVRAQDDGRCVRATAGGQSVTNAWNDGLLHPRHIVVDGSHGLTQTHQETHVGIFLHEGGDGLAGVVADERRDGAMAVLRLQTVMVGEGL